MRRFFVVGAFCLLSAVVAGCDGNPIFGDSRQVIAENETAIHLAIERFAAESTSASQSSRLLLAQRLSAMRQLQIDLNSIVPLEQCSRLHTEAKAFSSDIISTWSSITSVPSADPGSSSFDAITKSHDYAVGSLVSFAMDQTNKFEMLSNVACSPDEASNQKLSEIEEFRGAYFSTASVDESDQAAEICEWNFYGMFFVAFGAEYIQNCSMSADIGACHIAHKYKRIIDKARPCLEEPDSYWADTMKQTLTAYDTVIAMLPKSNE